MRMVIPFLIFTWFVAQPLSADIYPEVIPITDGKSQCTAFWVNRPTLRKYTYWVVSASHCQHLSKLEEANERINTVSWLGSISNTFIQGGADIAIGLVMQLEDPPSLALAEKMPESGEVTIVGFPNRVKTLATGTIIGPYKGDLRFLLGSVEIKIQKGSVTNGSSGSPVLNKEKKVVGVVWATNYNDIVYVTPIEKLIDLFTLVEGSSCEQSTKS